MKSPLKILHTLGTLNPGGVEMWLLRLLRSIDTSKFQFDFCTFGPDAGSYCLEVQRLGGVVHRCPLFPSSNLGRRFRKILREGQYDVVHSHVHFFSGALLRWASMEGVPIRVAHSHNSRDGKSDSPSRHIYRWLMKQWIQRYATHGLAASSEAAEDLFTMNWRKNCRIAILHYGIDLQDFRGTVDSHLGRAQVGLQAGIPVIGHVGNFVAAKNHSFFLKIVGQILKRRPEVQFLMVGDGPLREHIQAQAQTAGFQKNMHFLGTRTDVPFLLRSCIDAFLFPSLWEGLPNAVIEAQAAGLQCVISSEISKEVVVLPRQVVRLPLSIGAEEWAKITIESMNRGKCDALMSAQAMEKTEFCIEHSLSRLINLYSNEPAGAHAPSN